jgi:hypothetical protein
MDASPGDFSRLGQNEKRDDLLEKVQSARLERAKERLQHDSAKRVQAVVKGWMVRRKAAVKARSANAVLPHS